MDRREFVQLLGASALASDVAVFEPKITGEILVNPGIGLTTYNMASGEKEIANYPECSIAYFRLWWADLEKEEGRYNFEYLDSLLERARTYHQELAWRVQTWAAPWKLPRVVQVALPGWFRAKAKRYHVVRIQNSAKVVGNEEYWAPDFDDPYFLAKQEELIQAFGERYNGHPDMAYIDIGHMGNWGEWHTNQHQFNPYVPVLPMPTEENGRRIIDAYCRAWDKTVLVGNFQNAAEMRYATSKGAGWRCDGMDSKNCQERVHKLLEEPALRDAWKRGPVTGEPVARDVKNWEQMFNTVLSWHASSYNAYSVPVPDAVDPFVQAFLKKCGYRLVVRSVTVPRQAMGGGSLAVRIAMENVGVAPFYRDYVLAVRLRGGGREVVLDTEAKLRAFVPGQHTVAANLKLPPNIAQGGYELAIGVLHPQSRKPYVKLAIAGRDPWGCYPVGRVDIM